MSRYLVSALWSVVAGSVWIAAPATAHEHADPGAVIIDSDMGLDDTVALAIALQHPALDVEAMVVTPGAMGAESAAMFAERLSHRFNRSDVTLYQAAAPGDARTHAERYVSAALPAEAPKTRRPFAADAYSSHHGKTTLIALGPLTNLAAALREQPGLLKRIRRVVVPGWPNPQQNWNLRADPSAYEVVRQSGIPLCFVASGKHGAKPSGWGIGTADFGPGTSVGEKFVRALFANASARAHYLEALDHLTDELAILYVSQPTLFVRAAGTDNVFVPTGKDELLAALRRALTEGRQARPNTVLASGPLPDDVFQPRFRERRARIVAKNGQTEWSAQVLLNELHQHLGAYSIIGVKMGLHAAELLNAPQHGLHVHSRTDPQPPVSCLNDGLIVATGATPGRALFTHSAGERGDTRATFTYNGRNVTLQLKAEYQQRVRQHIQQLLQKHTLEDDEYWRGVEELGLGIWENWHRRDIFEIPDVTHD